VELDFTRPGKPTDNSDIESFNGKLRDECLHVTPFSDVVHAQQVIAARRIDYIEDRPHGALGQLTPREFAESRQQRNTSEAA
jgi:putative transposase